MEKKIEIIAVDFDGTLCSECYPAIGMPNLPLFALLKGARRQGKKVILCMERNPEKSPRTSISMTRRAGRG